MAAELTSGDASADQIVEDMHNNAFDLGEAGFDEIYGFGLIMPSGTKPE